MATVEEFFGWRKAERKKHRTMTLAEYHAWHIGGDLISHPSVSNPFPGGLTIILGPTSEIFGKIADAAPMPQLVDTIDHRR